MAVSTSSPLVAQTFDVERGDSPATESKEDAEEISIAYYIVYGLSLFLLVVGTWAFFFPFSESSIVGHVSGLGGLVTGLFVVLNSDLLVTYLLLLRELQRFRESNQKYRKSLVEQKKKLHKLRDVEKALKRLDKMCHGHTESIGAELDELSSTSRDTTRRNIAGVLSVVRPHQEDVRAGEDLTKIINMFCDIYIRAVPDVQERFAEMQKGLKASSRWQKVQSMSVDRLKFIIATALFEKLKDVKDLVASKADAETDEHVSGWHAVAASPSVGRDQKAWEAQYDGRLTASPEGQASAPVAGTDDDWGDAEAFAAGGKQEPALAAVTKEDSWADAVAFAEQGK